MSFLRTAFQTTRGARSANSELAWFQRVRVGGRVAYRRPGLFQVYPWYSLRCPQALPRQIMLYRDFIRAVFLGCL